MHGEGDFHSLGLLPWLSGCQRIAVIVPVCFRHVPGGDTASKTSSARTTGIWWQWQWSDDHLVAGPFCSQGNAGSPHCAGGVRQRPPRPVLLSVVTRLLTADQAPRLAWLSAVASPGPLNPLSSWGSVLCAAARGTLSEGGDCSAALQALPPPWRINPEAQGPGRRLLPSPLSPTLLWRLLPPAWHTLSLLPVVLAQR